MPIAHALTSLPSWGLAPLRSPSAACGHGTQPPRREVLGLGTDVRAAGRRIQGTVGRGQKEGVRGRGVLGGEENSGRGEIGTGLGGRRASSSGGRGGGGRGGGRWRLDPGPRGQRNPPPPTHLISSSGPPEPRPRKGERKKSPRSSQAICATWSKLEITPAPVPPSPADRGDLQPGARARRQAPSPARPPVRERGQARARRGPWRP